MIRVLEFFGQDVTKSPEVLAKCFADTTADVVKDANVIGLPTGCYLGAGSEVTTANGSKARLKSDGNWVWLAKADLITRTITENGTYEAADDNADGYVEVTVNVPSSTPTLVEKSITANGTYNPADDEADGYSEVSVNVPATKYEVRGELLLNSDGEVTSPNIDYDSADLAEHEFFKLHVSIPGTAEGIASGGLFYGVKGIYSVEVGEGITEIPENTFRDCAELTTVTLPSTITTIGDYAFAYLENIESLTCKAVTPPNAQLGRAFDSMNSECIIYVPAESVEDYKLDDSWSSRAAYIQAIPTT